MSSLKQQLKKIGTLDLRSVSEASRKTRASFLFSAREAADQDLETIYSIAYNGIMELVILDEKFAAFEKTLFSEKMKSVDRVLQTKEENEKLDASINSFLSQLSPYFLLKPSGKVLEYLIRRFRIQDFNVESIIRCILPYHETKSFVKMVSILNIEEKSPWEFLTPIKKSLLPLERSLLVKKMLKNRYVFDFICKTVNRSLVPFQTLYSFYAALLTDYIKLAPSVNTDMTIALTPHLIDGLKAKKLPELQLATYMILSQLSSKAVFSKEGVEALVDTMLRNYKKSYFSYCLLTTVHLCQTQESFETVSDSAIKAMFKHSQFEQTVLEITDKYATDRFFASFLKPMIRQPKNAQLLETLVLKGYLSSKNISLLCQCVKDNYLALAKDEESKKDFVSKYQSLLAMVSQRYVEELDVVLESKLNAVKDNEKLNKELYEFTTSAFKGTRHEIIEEANTTLYLCLNSPAITNRLLAIKKLVSIIDDKSNPLAQAPEIFESSLAGCLDQFNALFNYVLEEVPNHLLNYVAADKIIASFDQLLSARGAFNSKDAVTIIKFLLSDFIKKHPDQDAQAARILSVFIFSASSNNLTNLLKRIGSVSLKESPVLSAMLDNLKSAAKSEDKFEIATKFIRLQADLIKQNKKQEYADFWILMIKSKSKGESILGQLVISLALSIVTKPTEQRALGKCTLDAVLVAIQDKKDVFYSTRLSGGFVEQKGLPSKEVIKQLRNIDDVTPATFVQLSQFTLFALVTSVTRPEGDINWYRTNATHGDYIQLITKLFELFVSGPSVSAFEDAITVLVKSHLSTDVLRFLTSIWTNNEKHYVVRARALQVTSAYLSHYITTKNTKIDVQHLIPALFPTLGDSHQSVRAQGLHCLENVRLIYLSLGLPSGHKVYNTTIPSEDISKAKAATDITVLPASTFYDAAASITALKSNEAAHLADFIWYRHNEISKDHTYVTRVFKEYLVLCEESKEKQHKARKTHTLTFLLNHVNDAPTVEVKIHMLSMLDAIDSPLKLQLLASLLEKTLNEPRTTKSTVLVSYLIRNYLPSNASDLGVKNDKTLALFLRLLANKDTLQGADEDGWQVSTRHYALSQITPEFYAQANEKAQQAIFSSLVDIATNGVQNEVRASKVVLANIDVNAKLFEGLLVTAARNLLGSHANHVPSAKRGRTTAEVQQTSTVDLYELVTALELVESKTITKDETLVKPLFEVLTAMVNADLRDAPVSIEYINQLLMSALTRIIQHAEEKGATIEESDLRVDIVVQCIRITGNPQTHNQALLLMATIASMFPECVLHNIMPVFTFMGANVLRQDDNYSFQVIQQTLEKILPPLVVSSRKSNNDDEAALVLEVKPIIKVFVDALFHIPKHRRLRLFTVLIHTLGENEFLYAIISLLLEKFTERLAKGARSEAESLTEFSLVISQHFSPETQMNAILALLNGMLALPNEKPEDEDMSEKEAHLFNLSEHSAKQLRQYKLATLNFIGQLLTSKGFLSKVMTQGNTNEEFAQIMQPYYLQSVEIILKIIAYFTEYRDTYSVSKDAVPGIAKFWRAIIKVVYDVLDKVNALLPLDAFIHVISELIQHNDLSVRRKAMNIFNEKVMSFEGHAPEGSEDSLINMVKNLTNVIQKESTGLATEEESTVNKQSALLCIASLAKVLGNLYPGQFAEAIPIVIGPDSLQSSNSQLQISSLVCLTVVCQEIGPRAVPHLPKFMPIATDILNTTVEAENPNTLLQMGVITALETIVSVLPHFISPYITKILTGLLHPSVYHFDPAQTQRATIESKAVAVLSQLATNASPLFAFYETAVKNGKKSVLALCSVVSQAIRTMSRDVMTSHYKQLFKFFLIAFDVRRAHDKQFDEADIDDIEGSVISAFLDLVMKLNETLFKPLFLKVVDWATVELASENQDSLKRVLFFYKLVDSLLEKLKSIFTPYYGYLIDDVIMRLDRYKEEEQPIDVLWNYIMSALRKSFLYDNDNLWNATKFEKIMDPVVDQLLVTSKGINVDYLSRMNTYVVSCVGQMAVTVSNDTLWKPLNHKVLMKTREDDPEIRLAALKCIEEFYIRLGEEWLLFLAESISFLAELMEDDDIRVEKAVQQVNATIESHLGESLDKFFN
ncbi:HEAT repeat-containing protein 1 [Rhizopus stolonifer]|uniref:U3 small nucleolar RNA-associated protein 10 n=1 Tax=Rhizopus stolonifer TaxID=4846 RepID=A0A367KX49_RHIST|nr:HEAT repeat-containing protein 1 [Rhizopus stolonifer]